MDSQLPNTDRVNNKIKSVVLNWPTDFLFKKGPLGLFLGTLLMFGALTLSLAQADTLTYTDQNDFGNGDWANTANWQTGIVAGPSDNAIIHNNASSISSGIASVNSADFYNAVWDGNFSFGPLGSSSLILTVATMATFHDSSMNEFGTINGNTTFYDSSSNWQGIVNGNATFNNSSFNLSGTINGNATFNNASYNNGGIINGNVTFNDTSYTEYGTIYGNATFNTTWYSGTTAPSGGVLTINGSNYSFWSGDVKGIVYGSDNQAITSYVFNNSASSGNNTIINGNATFNNTSYNQGTINGNATFDTTYYSGTTAPSDGVFTINGSKHWSGDVEGIVYGSDSQAITSYVFNNSAYNNGTIKGDATFNNTSYNNSYGIINGDATFNNTSYNAGTMNRNATFNDTSYNSGTVNGNATFDTTYYSGTSTPMGGVLAINGSKYWSGDVTGTVYGSDNQAISSYVFNNSAYNTGTINGNATFDTTYYSGTTAPVDGVLTINGSKYWSGDVTGTVYGSDNQAITSYVFNNSAYNNGAINGNATFNNTSYNGYGGIINGNATLDTTYYSGTTAPVGGVLTINGSHHWYGDVTGTVYGADNQAITGYVFNSSAQNQGTINGNATFNNTSYNNSGTINGNATFNTKYYSGTIAPSGGVLTISGIYSEWSGDVTGTVYGSDNQAITSYVFNNGTGNSGTINGNATFNDSSSNWGSINGNATFNTTYYSGTTAPVGGVLTINGSNYNYWSGDVTGTVYGSDNQAITSYVFNNFAYNDGTINGNTTFNDTSYNEGAINGNATFDTTYYSGTTAPSGGVFTINDSNAWYGDVTGTVYGWDNQAITSYVFNDFAYNNGTIKGNATFNDRSYNNNGGIVNGNATFNDTSYNQGLINGNATFNTTWYSGTTAPSGGVLTINGNSSWSGDVTGTVYGADNQAITSYVFNNEAYNNGTINASVVFNSTADQSGIINAGNGIVTGDFSTSAGITFQSGTVLSDISGSGGLTKTGTGTVVLSGSNTYSGGTAISTGTLQVTNANALGTGNVVNNATLDIGTTNLSLGGAYTQNTGSALNLAIDSTSSFGRISSVVAASVAGGSTINVTVAGNILKNTTFTILNTNGTGINLANGLPTVVSSSPQVSFTDSYSNGNLVLTANSSTPGFSALANNGNSQTVTTVLNNITNPSSGMTTLLNTLGSLSNKQISAALGSMGPVVDRGIMNTSTSSLTSSIEASLERAQNVLTLAASRNGRNTGVSSGDESPLNGMWAKEYGGYLDQGTREGISGYSAWNTGTVVGMDHLVSDNLTVGASLGYAYGNINSADNSGSTYVNSAEGTLYAGYQGETHPFYVDAAGSFAWNWYNGQRNIDSINSVADSSYQGQQSSIYLDGGYKFDVGHNVTLTPLASLQWTHLAIGSYTETNAGVLDLMVNRQSYNMLESGLGAGISYEEKYAWGTFTPELHAKWLYDYISDPMVVTSAFTGGGASFTSTGASPARDGVDIGSKLSFDFKKDTSLIAGLDAELKDSFFGIYGSVSMRYKF